MRARPVDFAARGAAAEIGVVNFRERLELLEHFGFVHAFQETVALQAASVGRDQLSQIETSDYFNDLLGGIMRSRAVAMPYDFVHEQTAISRQQRPIVGAARDE